MGTISEDESWTGSWVEARIELGRHDDGRLRGAVDAAWSHPLLSGPTSTNWPSLDAVLTDEGTFDFSGKGTFRLGGDYLGCAVTAMRDPTSDWLFIGSPTGMLHAVGTDVDYSWEPGANPWLRPMIEALVDVAERVAQSVPFELAAVGPDVITPFPDSHLREFIARYGGFLVGDRRWRELALDVGFTSIPSGLRWIPPRDAGSRGVHADEGPPESASDAAERR